MSVAAGVALAVADAVWAQIKAAGHATDEHLSILDHLFGKNMLRACKILDEGGVRRVTGAPSGRSLFLVMGESKRKEEYICFPEHLCTCYSFFYDIVGRGEQLCCKHQLAARLAEAVGKHQEMEAQINIFLLLLHRLLKTCFEAPRPHEIGSFLYCKRHPVSHLAVMKSCNNNSGPFTLRSQNCGVGAGPHRLDEGSSWRKAYHQLLKAS